MRAQQADLAARLAEHQRGLQEVHRMSFTARQAQAGLEESQRTGFQTLTRIAEQQGAAIGAQNTKMGALREQFRRQGRHYAANFRARASSSSASEPAAEPRGRARERA